MTIRFTSMESKQFAKWLQTRSESAVQNALYGTAMAIVSKILNEIIPAEPRQPVDVGTYRAGWKFKKIPKGAMVYNSVPHAILIEKGVRAANVKPGRAMREAITQWLIFKKITSMEDAPKVAWAVMMAMKKRGIFNEGKGLRILEKAMKFFPELLDREFKIQFRRAFAAKGEASK